MITANSSVVKSVNRKSVLEVLRKAKLGITKQDMANITKLTFAAVGNIIAELERMNLIKQMGYAESSGGRKPILYSINPDAYITVGLHIGVGKTICIVTNLEGTILAEETSNFSIESDVNDVLEQQVILIKTVLVSAGKSVDECIGLGISSPGPIDPINGVILTPPNLPKWKDVAICSFFEKALQVPAFLEKDANASALAELWFGEGQDKKNILYLLVDSGIGSGLIMEGQIYRGYTNVAGEIGHGTIHLDGPRCNCGNYGCLEVMASGEAIVRRVKEEIRRGCSSILASRVESLSIEAVLEGNHQGDDLCRRILQESSRYVGIGLAGKINFLNPEMIVIGGRIPEEVDLYFQWVKEIARERIFQETNDIQFAKSTFSYKSEALGATTRVIENIFKAPVLQ